MISTLVAALLLLAPGPSERPVAVPAAGGVTLSATLAVPPGPGPFPAAVLVGGFGPANRDGVFGDRPGGTYRELARGLARRGVAVLRYDKRGIGGSDGPALSWLDARPLLADAVAVTRLLSGLPGVDRRRVTMIGHSQGGDLVLAAAPRAPATRLVTLAAPGRALGSLPRVAGTAGRLLRRLAGPAVARATLGGDPVRDAARARQPALLVQGTRDRTVPPRDVARLAAARRRADRPTRTLLVPGAGHFLQVEGRVPARAIDAIAAFASS